MRVVGLDIHPDRVSAIEIDTAFGRFEIRDTHENTTASALLNSLQKKPERLVCSIPPEISTFRNLQIASKDRKAVKNALDFELEDDLPFEKESIHYDSVILSSGNQGSLIHVSATKKENFDAYIKKLNESGVDPEIITTDPWAYRSLLQRISPSIAILLVGIERNKTFFYVHNDQQPLLYREVPFGIQNIELALEKNLGATPTQIKNWIKDVGVSGIDPNVSNCISDALEFLTPEFKQTELAARAILKNIVLQQVWVTGEGALLPGLMAWLESASEKKTSLFKPLSLISANKLNYSDVTEIHFSKALALGMSVIAADKLNPINLRRGIFSKVALEGSSIWEMIRKPLPYVAIMALVFFATKSIEYRYYESRLNDIDTVLKKSVKNYFSSVNGTVISDSGVKNYLADPAKLKKTAQSELAKEREMSKVFAQNQNSPVNFLKSLSQKIGKDIVIDVTRFEAGSELTDAYKENRPFNTSITVLVANSQMLAKVSDLLEKFYKLKKGASEEVKQEGKKYLKVIFSGTVENSK